MGDNAGTQVGINYIQTTQQEAVGVLLTPLGANGGHWNMGEEQCTSRRGASVSRDTTTNRSRRQHAPRTGQDYSPTFEV